MASLLLSNCRVIHPGSSPQVVSELLHVLIEGKLISYVGDTMPQLKGAQQVVDLGGRFVSPGLCDAHVHVTAVTANLRDLYLLPPSLIAARSSKLLADMLMRGFTTVRDMGGCDWGLAKAVEEGTILGPRLLFGGYALSQTGGHGDMRLPGDNVNHQLCSCSAASLSLGRICDGVPEVRRAAREELRRGAHHIKIMASGGVSSPTDAVGNLQFSVEEMLAAVEEAENCGKYVAAHAYTAAAVKRALQVGVRSIEHGNLIDEECLQLMKYRGAFLVPTLVTYKQICEQGEVSGMAPELVAKARNLLKEGMQVTEAAESMGVNICFGSDLLGSMQNSQPEEFLLRSRIQTAASVLKSATATCAQLFNMVGLVGTVSVGAFADLIVLDSNPLEDITVLADPNNLVMILKEGQIVKSSLP